MAFWIIEAGSIDGGSSPCGITQAATSEVALRQAMAQRRRGLLGFLGKEASLSVRLATDRELDDWAAWQAGDLPPILPADDERLAALLNRKSARYFERLYRARLRS